MVFYILLYLFGFVNMRLQNFSIYGIGSFVMIAFFVFL